MYKFLLIFIAMPLPALAGALDLADFETIPDTPQANNPFSLSLNLGPFPSPCFTRQPNPQGLLFDLNQDANTLHLDIVLNSGPAVCTFPYSHEYPFPALPVGTYEIFINKVDPSTQFPATSDDRQFVGVFQLDVRPNSFPVNTLSPLSLIFLISIVVITACLAIARKIAH